MSKAPCPKTLPEMQLFAEHYQPIEGYDQDKWPQFPQISFCNVRLCAAYCPFDYTAMVNNAWGKSVSALKVEVDDVAVGGNAVGEE